ncbi:hypothetical protein B0H11DRAFT_1948668, partial [Mycena galericulata]
MAIHQRVGAYSQTLSAFRHVPPEILQEIFLFGTLVPGPGTLPWSLGHVFSRWRKAALGLPALWSAIATPDFTDANDNHECSGLLADYPLPSLRMLLEQSADKPLHVFLNPACDIRPSPPSSAFCETLTNSSPR